MKWPVVMTHCELQVAWRVLSGEQAKHGSGHCFHVNLRIDESCVILVIEMLCTLQLTSPTEVASKLTIRSCGTATTYTKYTSY